MTAYPGHYSIRRLSLHDVHTKFDFFAGNVSCLYGCKSPASPALYFTPQTACRKMPGHLYSEVGERYLLHGTSPNHLLDILEHGFSEKLASLKGLFGAGNYFAEAPASWPITLIDFMILWDVGQPGKCLEMSGIGGLSCNSHMVDSGSGWNIISWPPACLRLGHEAKEKIDQYTRPDEGLETPGLEERLPGSKGCDDEIWWHVVWNGRRSCCALYI